MITPNKSKPSPKLLLNATPGPQKALTLSQEVHECKPLVSGGAGEQAGGGGGGDGEAPRGCRGQETGRLGPRGGRRGPCQLRPGQEDRCALNSKP